MFSPGEQSDERGGSVLDSVDDRLAVADAAVAHPRPDLGEERRPPVVVVGDDEALDPQPLRHDQEEVPRARPATRSRCTARRLRRRRRDRAREALRAPPRASARRRCRSTRRFPPVSASRAGTSSVVERLVEPDLSQPRDLLGRARAPDHPAALQLRDLAGDGSRRARRRPRRRPSHRPRPGRCRGGPRTPSGPACRARRARSTRAPAQGRGRRARRRPRAPARASRGCATTHEPSSKRPLRDAMTCPTAPPVSGSPSANGGTYDFASFIRPRMYGSTDMNAFRISTSPSAGSGTSTSTSAKSVGCGTPRGRAARWISRLVGMEVILEARCGRGVRAGQGARPSQCSGGLAPRTTARRRPRSARPELPPQRHPRRRARRGGRDGRDPEPALAGLGRRRRPSARGARRRRRARPRRRARATPGDRRARGLPRPDEAAALVLGSIGFLPGEIETAADVGSLARARVFAGYAGWGPGQLESEIAEESWILEPALPDDVFTDEPDELWSAVLRRKGGAFAVLALMPPDPSSN